MVEKCRGCSFANEEFGCDLGYNLPCRRFPSKKDWPQIQFSASKTEVRRQRIPEVMKKHIKRDGR